MNGYTHMVVGGLSAGLVVAAAMGMKTIGVPVARQTLYPLLMVVPSVIGGLGPDIDMPSSKAGRFIRKALLLTISGLGAGLLGLCAATMIGGGVWGTVVPMAVFFVLACALMAFVVLSKHRRQTHSGVVCLILFLPVVWMVYGLEMNIMTNVLFSVWFGFWIGWLSHLVADTFNKKGVPWLYPLTDKRGKVKYYSLMSVTTGTDEEKVFRIAVVVLAAAAYAALILLGGVLV